jgi:hypothetical protein
LVKWSQTCQEASSFGAICPSEEKIFLTLANQKKELLFVAIFVGQMAPNEDASWQVWLHLTQTWQEASM